MKRGSRKSKGWAVIEGVPESKMGGKREPNKRGEGEHTTEEGQKEQHFVGCLAAW